MLNCIIKVPGMPLGLHGNSRTRSKERNRIKMTIWHHIWPGGGTHHTYNTNLQKSSHFIYTLLILLSLYGHGTAQIRNCTNTAACYPPFRKFQRLVDVETYVNLSASSTCGDSGKTMYQKPADSLDNTLYTCNTTELALSNAYDFLTVTQAGIELTPAIFTTYWMTNPTVSSGSSVINQESITLQLAEKFLITSVRITFVAAKIPKTTTTLYDQRPLAMCFQFQLVKNGAYTYKRCYAENCKRDFPNVASGLCQQKYYSGHQQTQTGYNYFQVVLYEPVIESAKYQTDYAAQKSLVTYGVKAVFTRPADSMPARSYYAVADISVDGQCACFGHATQCTGPSNATCVCQHNTMGPNCEQCLPLFNNKPWSVGYGSNPNICEDCQCNGHASSCHYEAAKQYGVCDNCIKQTTGDKCQFCKMFYYVNPQTNTTNATCTGMAGPTNVTYSCNDWCIPCDCSTLGSIPDTGYRCQNSTGQCDCKLNVQGRRCDTCKDEYWNLVGSNVFGCQRCDCNIAGTFNSSNFCDKQNGTCVCKANVMGRKCDTCKSGTYQLFISNQDGCLPCNCIPGASFSSVCLSNALGQCRCRNRLGGRTCDRPEDGFFVAKMDYLKYEAEFALNIVSANITTTRVVDPQITGTGVARLEPLQNINWAVTIPTTAAYNIVLRFQQIVSLFSLSVSFKQTGGAFSTYACGNTTVTSGEPITLSRNFDGDQFNIPTIGSINLGSACLKAGTTYSMAFNMSSALRAGKTFILLDSVVLIPAFQDLALYKTALPAEQTQIETCFNASMAKDTVTRSTDVCKNWEYAVMASIYSGAILCRCNSLGTQFGTVCDAKSGQCTCKPGVMMLDCSMCKVNYFNFNSGAGCTACNCSLNGSISQQCNAQGICQCKPNVIGHKCDQCLPEFFGLSTGNGCTKCQCSTMYSVSNNCQDSGQCPCKPGVGGITCNQCQDGFFNLTTSGCTSCGCNLDGTLHNNCDKKLGGCVCKSNAIGPKCNQCPVGNFGLGPYGPNGCLPCLCSGHSRNCTTAAGWFAAQVSSKWSLNDISALEPNFGAIGADGSSASLTTPTAFSGQAAQFVMRITNDPINLPKSDIFYTASSNFLGDKRTAYGMSIVFTLSLTIPQPMCPTVVNVTSNSTSNATSSSNATAPSTTIVMAPCNDTKMLTSSLGDIILQSASGTFSLVAGLPSIPTENMTRYEIFLREALFKVNGLTGIQATYLQMIQTLSNLGSIRIRGKFSNVSNSYVDLFNFYMNYASVTNTLLGAATNVENCSCPTGFTGQFCEKCSPGFTRSVPNGGPFSTCVPCACNNHSVTPVVCDSETGACNCTDNTAGVKCEKCADGYFGNALLGTANDCKPCMCPGNVVAGDINVFASTCSLNATSGQGVCKNCSLGYAGPDCGICAKNWYGTPKNVSNNLGKCTPCNCRGRADTCDSITGVCIDCRNNTTGKECEICYPTFFGNADQFTCKPCGCTSLGSTGGCNPATGQCECKPNVQGFKCDSCLPDTFNYNSGIGCSPCDCHPQGAFSTSCNVTTGQCQCRPKTIGRQCDSCQVGYWNLNTITGCDACNCSIQGTQQIGGVLNKNCNITTGQCACKTEAIGGRKCDVCNPGTKGIFTYISGVKIGIFPSCQLCGECYDTWASRIDDVAKQTYALYRTALVIWSHYDNQSSTLVQPVLDLMARNITNAKSSISMAIEMSNTLQYLSSGFQNLTADISQLNGTLLVLEAQQADLQGKLVVNQQFKGTIQLTDQGPVMTPGAVLAQVQSIQTTAQGYIQTGQLTFQNISSLTETIKNSNSTALQGAERVAAAMRDVSVAEENRQIAEGIINNTFTTSFAQNNVEIGGIMSVTSTFVGIDTSLKATVTSAKALIQNANQTLISAQATIVLKKTSIDAKVAEGLTTQGTTAQAQIACQNAQTAACAYKTIGQKAKTDMTTVIVNLARDLQQIRGMLAEESTIQAQANTINTLTLRPLSAMQAITSKITSTSISPTKVAQISANAAAAKREADAALTQTQVAIDKARAAQSMVQSIRDDLNNATAKRINTAALIDTLSNQNATINSVLTEVNAKADVGVTAAASGTTTINSLLAYIDSINKCFNQRQLEAQTSLTSVQNNNAVITVTQTNQETNKANLNQVAVMAATKLSNVQDQKSTLETTQATMNSLSASLATAKQSSDLNTLLLSFNSQSTQLKQAQDDLAAIEVDLDDMIALLSKGVDRVECSSTPTVAG